MSGLIGLLLVAALSFTLSGFWAFGKVAGAEADICPGSECTSGWYGVAVLAAIGVGFLALASRRPGRQRQRTVEDDAVSAVVRLVTFVDLADDAGDPARMSISARQEAELPDGRRVVLLDDRGWSSTVHRAGDPSALDAWATTSVEEIEQEARVVVGPDEPPEGSSQEDAERDHWAYLSEILRQQGVAADALDLKRLPHDVVLSERLLARVGRADES